MASQAVGFQVQGDVIGGASLVYSATGRLLKALNNDGVDFYAVGASVQLGKLIPLSQEREAAICRLLEQRRVSRESYLSKALRIGWGYSSVPHELARTRAGVSALNIIGAFATGCPPFESAKALSTLMQIYGCEADALPSLDSLSTMIEFLSPFVTNSTFDVVIAKIELGCINILANNGFSELRALKASGNSVQWARLVKHLMATSIALEHAHVAVAQRGIWLSAFATHILGMSVTVYFKDAILWEAAGANGSVNLYLYDKPAEFHSLTRSLSTNVQLERLEPSIDSKDEPSMLLLNQLFESGIEWVRTAEGRDKSYVFEVDEIMIDHIREAICRLSEQVFDNEKMRLRDVSWPINGRWPLRKEPLSTVLQQLGVLSFSQTDLTSRDEKRSKGPTLLANADAFKHVGQQFTSEHDKALLRAICCLRHESEIRISRLCESFDKNEHRRLNCLCYRSASFIHSMSALAVALAQCSYDQNMIRINEKMLRNSFWRVESQNAWLENSSECYYESLFAFLIQVLDRYNRYNDFDSRYVVAWSEGGIAIYNRALIDSECFDNYGRFLVITSGSISCNGLRRKLVVDGARRYLMDDSLAKGSYNTFDLNTEITPFSAKGPITYDPIIEIERARVKVSIKIFNLEQIEKWLRYLRLTDCMVEMLANCKIIGQKCGHASQPTYVVRQAHSPIIVHTLGEINRTLDLKTEMNLVFAVAGSPLSQMLQAFFLSRDGYCFALQGDSCLDCILTEAKKDPKIKAVIMS